MTCIVGLIKNKTVYMGADSAGSNGTYYTIRKDEKVFHNGPFTIGFTSSFRMGQILRYSFKPPTQPADMNDTEFMCTLFIDEVRKALFKGGYAKKENEQEEGGTFLVGYKGIIYEIDNDYQVGIPTDDVATCGSGHAVALGALFASKELEPEQRIRVALEAAEHHCDGVRGPFHVLKNEGVNTSE